MILDEAITTVDSICEKNKQISEWLKSLKESEESDILQKEIQAKYQSACSNILKESQMRDYQFAVKHNLSCLECRYCRINCQDQSTACEESGVVSICDHFELDINSCILRVIQDARNRIKEELQKELRYLDAEESKLSNSEMFSRGLNVYRRGSIVDAIEIVSDITDQYLNEFGGS